VLVEMGVLLDLLPGTAERRRLVLAVMVVVASSELEGEVPEFLVVLAVCWKSLLVVADRAGQSVVPVARLLSLLVRVA
jgi:hypothetical protein